ncbi:MAG TPA: class I SAM-dependent methyltransferase [Firmicutes bacterium]|nr:class I SAM-dependent methyltransferase [Bacillota bacterium]
MNYQKLLNERNESQFLISMTPVNSLVELGFSSGMNSSSTVLDLCCGYGEMLKIWHQALGVRGTGVDICGEFIQQGKKRLAECGITDVALIESDIFKWNSDEKYDYVCLSGEEFGGLQSTVTLLEGFMKPDGKLIIGTRFSKVENPPQELVDFEGELLTLNEINAVFQSNGYFITDMASDTHHEWERYIMWSARRHLAELRKDIKNQSQMEWCQKWYDIYFRLRRPLEGYATFVIEKI